MSTTTFEQSRPSESDYDRRSSAEYHHTDMPPTIHSDDAKKPLQFPHPLDGQSFMALWYHDVEIVAVDYKLMRFQLDKHFKYIRIFDDCLTFIDYIQRKIIVPVIFLMITSTDFEHIDFIAHERLKKERLNVYKFKTIPDDLDNLFIKICRDMRKYLGASTAITKQSVNEFLPSGATYPRIFGFNSSSKQSSFRNLTKESIHFLWVQTFTEILTRMQHSETTKLEMISHCRNLCTNQREQWKKIDEFAKYTPSQAISYYTKDTFLFRLLNLTFRREDLKGIFKFRSYICDLHEQLAQLGRNQKKSKPLILFRGMKIEKNVLQQLNDNIDGLISMNGFLSTTRSEEVAMEFCGDDTDSTSTEKRTLFRLEIENENISTPFASVYPERSLFPQEEEVLFSVGSVWLVEAVDENKQENIWTVRLRSSNNLNKQLEELLETELPQGRTVLALGDIVQKLGDIRVAEYFYQCVLEELDVTEEEEGIINYTIGMMRANDGDLACALTFLEKAVNLVKASSFSRSIFKTNLTVSRLSMLYRMGRIYQHDGRYIKAQKCYEKACDEYGSNDEHSSVYYRLGELAFCNGQYKQAHKHHTKAVELVEDIQRLKVYTERLNDITAHLEEQREARTAQFLARDKNHGISV